MNNLGHERSSIVVTVSLQKDRRMHDALMQAHSWSPRAQKISGTTRARTLLLHPPLPTHPLAHEARGPLVHAARFAQKKAGPDGPGPAACRRPPGWAPTPPAAGYCSAWSSTVPATAADGWYRPTHTQRPPMERQQPAEICMSGGGGVRTGRHRRPAHATHASMIRHGVTCLQFLHMPSPGRQHAATTARSMACMLPPRRRRGLSAVEQCQQCASACLRSHLARAIGARSPRCGGGGGGHGLLVHTIRCGV
jgi:hypothetical protein